MLSTLQFPSIGHVFGFRQRRKHNLPRRRARPQITKESYFGLCDTSFKFRYRNHWHKLISQWTVQKRNWDSFKTILSKSRFFSSSHCVGSAFWLGFLPSKRCYPSPPLWIHVHPDKPIIYWHFCQNSFGTFPTDGSKLILKIIFSPFKTLKRKLNIGIKNCFLVLRFSEISSQKKKNDAKAVELRMQNDWGEFIS